MIEILADIFFLTWEIAKYLFIIVYGGIPTLYLLCVICRFFNDIRTSFKKQKRKIDWMGKHVLLVGTPNEFDSEIISECIMKGAYVVLLWYNSDELEKARQFLVSS